MNVLIAMTIKACVMGIDATEDDDRQGRAKYLKVLDSLVDELERNKPFSHPGGDEAAAAEDSRPKMPLPFTAAQIERLYRNSPELTNTASSLHMSLIQFKNLVGLVERAHGIRKDG